MVVGIGEALWDMLPEGKKVGGAPANFAFHVAQFGYESKAVSAIGNDAMGDELLSLFDKNNLDYNMIRVNYPTGVVHVELDINGVPKYDIKENVAWDHIPFTDELEYLAKQTRIVCFGSLAQRNEESRSTIYAFLDAMHEEENFWRVFDINLRQHYYSKKIISESLDRCNILKINDDEIKIFAQMFELKCEEYAQMCLEIIDRFNLQIVILTCGAVESFVVTPQMISRLATPKVKVADTVGAGDSFTAAFCVGLLQGKTLSEAHHQAVKVSAYVCTQKGAMAILPKELVE